MFFNLHKIVHILSILVMYNILRVLITSGVSPWNRIKEVVVCIIPYRNHLQNRNVCMVNNIIAGVI